MFNLNFQRLSFVLNTIVKERITPAVIKLKCSYYSPATVFRKIKGLLVLQKKCKKNGTGLGMWRER